MKVMNGACLLYQPTKHTTHTNVITFELKSLDDKATHEASTLTVTTWAMRGNVQAENEVEGQEEYCLDEGLNLSYSDRVAKITTRVTRELEN